MRRLQTIRRSGSDVTAIWEDDNEIVVGSFPADWNDDAIKAYIMNGTEPPPAPRTENEPDKTPDEPFLPPPAPPEKKITKQEMLAALESAGITGFKNAKFFVLKSEYEKAIADGTIKA